MNTLTKKAVREVHLDFTTQSYSHYTLIDGVLTVERVDGHPMGNERWVVSGVMVNADDTVVFTIPMKTRNGTTEDYLVRTSPVFVFSDTCGCGSLCVGRCFV